MPQSVTMRLASGAVSSACSGLPDIVGKPDSASSFRMSSISMNSPIFSFTSPCSSRVAKAALNGTKSTIVTMCLRASRSTARHSSASPSTFFCTALIVVRCDGPNFARFFSHGLTGAGTVGAGAGAGVESPAASTAAFCSVFSTISAA